MGIFRKATRKYENSTILGLKFNGDNSEEVRYLNDGGRMRR